MTPLERLERALMVTAAMKHLKHDEHPGGPPRRVCAECGLEAPCPVERALFHLGASVSSTG